MLVILGSKLGRYMKYIAGWIDELPPMTIMINEGVKIVYKGSDDKGDYYEIKPI